jgi:hypothetical protein
VPVVLNMISYTETSMGLLSVDETAMPRPRFGLGACLPALAPAATPASKSAVAVLRPRTGRTASVVGQHSGLAAAGQAVQPPLNDRQFTYTTLISATGAGELGSHPARDPV